MTLLVGRVATVRAPADTSGDAGGEPESEGAAVGENEGALTFAMVIGTQLFKGDSSTMTLSIRTPLASRRSNCTMGIARKAPLRNSS